MKLTHFSRILKFAFFLAILYSFTTAYAYDFEVDGIYYNITSTNTVEVTYKDTNYDSYSGEVIIPSTVTHNNKIYTVTTIGDSAFFCSDLLDGPFSPQKKAHALSGSSNHNNVTIPESVVSIGEAAFYNINFGSICCLAPIPPSLFGSSCFRIHEFSCVYSYGEYYLWSDGGNDWCYPDGDKWRLRDQRAWTILYVLPNYYESYKADNAWKNYFNFIVPIGAEQSADPIVTLTNSEYTIRSSYEDGNNCTFLQSVKCGRYMGHYNTSTWFVGSSGSVTWDCYEPDEWHSYVEFEVSAIAVEDGKLPSNIVKENIYIYLTDLLDEEVVGEENEIMYDFCVDGICYNYLGENSVAVAPDAFYHLVWKNLYFRVANVENTIDREESYFGRLGLYKEKVVIPMTVDYNGRTYDVISIGSNVMGAIERYYDYNEYRIDYGEQGIDIYPSSYCVWIEPCFPTCLTIPTSIHSIGDNAFPSNGNLQYVHLTSDGAWSAGALDVAVQRLDIASGITAIPGLKVNPREVYCYAKVPPTCDENTFTDYTGTLHVPESSLAAYFTAPYWCNFADIVGDAVELTDLTLNKDSAELLVGQQLALNATIHPANANIDSIEWSSSNEGIATVVDGVVTAKALGECDIIVTCLDKRDTCHVKVVEQIVTITLDQHRASLLPNHILTLTPTVTPAGADLVVTSSNPAVAAARLTNGKVQVVGVSVGTAIIKVASADNNAVADSCIVNVYTDAGDVDGDGFVKIDDVTVLIDHLLGGNPSIDVTNADINYDGAISIADVTTLIDILLNGDTGISSRETFTVNGISFTMIRVAPGTFRMGATEEQGSDVYNWEKPAHEVTLTSPYLIGETEVTQELWLAVMGTNPSKHTGSLQKPVENVTWPDCQEFIARLNQLTGLSFRLPTEAEWEYAARGGSHSHGYKYAGSDYIADVGNISSSTTLPVGSLQANELYLYDMSGNVDEWVSDYWGSYTSGPQTNPTGPSSGTEHVYRSGSWYSGADVARVSYRFHRSNTFQRGTLGLRLAL